MSFEDKLLEFEAITGEKLSDEWGEITPEILLALSPEHREIFTDLLTEMNALMIELKEGKISVDNYFKKIMEMKEKSKICLDAIN